MNSALQKILKNHVIEIPIIQRDYAQGRNSVASVRNDFLRTIKQSLNNKKKLNLDFIYGTTIYDNGYKKFIPLDGQQRLTTLFLIYWYIAQKENKLEAFKNLFTLSPNNSAKAKLRYKVRAGVEEFLDELVSFEIDFSGLSSRKISEIIKNQYWFFLEWQKDPSIQGMLNMLDSIHYEFSDFQHEIFEDLTDLEKPLITFEFLDLEEFKLTDELYIKMNARGKLLTTFENFKAKFEKLLKISGHKRFDEFVAKIEKEYLDFFWKKAIVEKVNRNKHDKLLDNYLHNFFYNFTLNLFAIEKPDLLSQYGNLNNFIEQKSILDFYEDVYNNPNHIDSLIDWLDEIRTLPNDDIIEKSWKSIDLSIPERIRLYAYFLSRLYHKNDKHWFRVVNNLINNTLIQSLKDYWVALNEVNELSKKTRNLTITDFLINQDASFINLFDKEQQQEEIIKAGLLKEADWEKEILDAEKHWYLEGKIGFLLEFSKKQSYDLDEFVSYKNKFRFLWDWARNNSHHILIYQALLSIGDYLPSVGKNHTFCSFENAIRAKHDSWHKVFNSAEKREYLKKLLDKIELNNDLEEQLIEIKKEYVQKDWRKFLIENDIYIRYCSNLRIRKVNGKIFLMTTKHSLKGKHKELHSWYLFENNPYFKRDDCHYKESKSNEEPSIEYNDESLDCKIYYVGNDLLTIVVSIKDFDNSEDIAEKLIKLDFIENEDHEFYQNMTYWDALHFDFNKELLNMLKDDN